MDDLARLDNEIEPDDAGGLPPAGFDASEPAGIQVRILALWLPAQSRRRLLDHDADVVDEAEEPVDLALVSTRAPMARRQSMGDLVERGVPVAVLCHPGGESIAAELMALGATTVVAEGSEQGAIAVHLGEASGHLVDNYAEQLQAGDAGSSADRDPVTGLPTAVEFGRRLAELCVDGAVPRLGLVDLGDKTEVGRVGGAGWRAVRRRLAVAAADVTVFGNAELYALGATRLAFVSASMPAEAAAEMARTIVELGSSFSPGGDRLEVVAGIAGPETATDATNLMEAAERAVESARARGPAVVDSAEVAGVSAGVVEMSAAIVVADAVDALDPSGDHSVRVARLAVEMATELGLEPREIATVGLAARLHDVGKLGFGLVAFEPEAEGHDQAVRRHPEQGEDFARYPAGSEAASIIRGHHEQFDGSGYPDGLSGEEIPLGARILAVVDLYDRLTTAGKGGPEIRNEIEAKAGTAFDPDLVAVAMRVLGL